MAERKESMFNISTDGNVVTAKATDGQTVAIDVTTLPIPQRDAAIVAGVVQMLRTSYANASSVNDGLRRLGERVTALQNGSWLPGTRESAPREPDDLALAVMEVVGINFHVYENDFLPNWLAKYTTKSQTSNGQERTKGKATALKTLAEHKSVAPIMARLAAARAKSSRGNEGPSLTDFVAAPAQAAE